VTNSRGEERSHTGTIGCKCMDYQLADEVKTERKMKVLRKQLEIFDEHSLINEKLKNASFTNYIPSNPKQERAKKLFMRYAEVFDPDKPINLYCYGSFGIGKSHLAKSSADDLMKKGKSCIFISVPKLLRKLKDTYNKESIATEDKLLQALEAVDVLILDDIYSEKPTKWALEKMFDIIDSRQGKHTIYTSNMSPDEMIEDMEELKDRGLRKQAERIFSRILNEDTELVEMEGQNYRLRKHLNP
jgi:DNA replication protein DnaC